MINYKEIREAQDFIVREWGEDGEHVIEACLRARPFGGTQQQFLSVCIGCGGNWTGMLLSGIKDLFPEVYDAIPEQMGHLAWTCLVYVLELLDVREDG